MYAIDDKTIQALNYLQVMFDFLKNPEKYKTLVSDYQNASQEYAKTYSELVKAEDFKTWSEKVQSEINKDEIDLKTSQDAFDAKMLDLQTKHEEKVLALQDKETALQNKEQILASRESGIVSKESTLNLKQATMDSEYQKLQAAKADLSERESALAEKADKIKALLG